MRGKVLIIGFVVLAALGCGDKHSGKKVPAQADENKAPVNERPLAAATSYQVTRKDFKTRLKVRGPAPQEFSPISPPDDVKELTYPSDGLALKAWLSVPKENSGKHPALVFFHGGFAFGEGDFEMTQPFVDAGFVVMTPMLRGENGNPGDFELFLAEVDDAAAAVRWLAKRDNVDASRIYAIGHSAGGAIAALLSLHEELPLKHSASIGGLYGPHELDDLAPFDVTLQTEQRMRTLVGNVADMQSKHFAYVGRDDYYQERVDMFKSEISKEGTALKLLPVVGDHFDSVSPAMSRYLVCAKDEARCSQ